MNRLNAVRRARETPAVSVIIPAYNAERTIERTVESVRAQTHERLEIVIVDDGSTDDTGELLESFARRDNRIRIVHQANGGVARARNRGLELATNEFVAPIDADDLWHPTKVEKQLAVMLASNDDTAFVYSPCRVIDEHDQVVGSACAFALRGHVLCRHVLVNFVGNGSALLLRRSAALEVGGYDTTLRDRGLEGSEDFLLQLRLAKHHRVDVVPEYLVGYRKMPGTMSWNIERMVLAELAAREHFQREAPDVTEPAFRWGAAARLADCALRSAGRGRSDHAFRMLMQGIRLDGLGVAMHLAAQAGARARRSVVRGRVRLRSCLGAGNARYMRPFHDYHPAEAMVVRPSWLVGRRLAQLALADARRDTEHPKLRQACAAVAREQ